MQAWTVAMQEVRLVAAALTHPSCCAPAQLHSVLVADAQRLLLRLAAWRQ